MFIIITWWLKYFKQSKTLDDNVTGIKNQSYIGSLPPNQPYLLHQENTQHIHVPILVFIDISAKSFTRNHFHIYYYSGNTMGAISMTWAGKFMYRNLIFNK